MNVYKITLTQERMDRITKALAFWIDEHMDSAERDTWEMKSSLMLLAELRRATPE